MSIFEKISAIRSGKKGSYKLWEKDNHDQVYSIGFGFLGADCINFNLKSVQIRSGGSTLELPYDSLQSQEAVRNDQETNLTFSKGERLKIANNAKGQELLEVLALFSEFPLSSPLEELVALSQRLDIQFNPDRCFALVYLICENERKVIEILERGTGSTFLLLRSLFLASVDLDKDVCLFLGSIINSDNEFGSIRAIARAGTNFFVFGTKELFIFKREVFDSSISLDSCKVYEDQEHTSILGNFGNVEPFHRLGREAFFYRDLSGDLTNCKSFEVLLTSENSKEIVCLVDELIFVTANSGAGGLAQSIPASELAYLHRFVKRKDTVGLYFSSEYFIISGISNDQFITCHTGLSNRNMFTAEFRIANLKFRDSLLMYEYPEIFSSMVPSVQRDSGSEILAVLLADSAKVDIRESAKSLFNLKNLSKMKESLVDFAVNAGTRQINKLINKSGSDRYIVVTTTAVIISTTGVAESISLSEAKETIEARPDSVVPGAVDIFRSKKSMLQQNEKPVLENVAIEDFHYFEQTLESCLLEPKPAAATLEPSATIETKSKKDRLMEIKGLFDEGLIDEEEFKAEKSKILNS